MPQSLVAALGGKNDEMKKSGAPGGPAFWGVLVREGRGYGFRQARHIPTVVPEVTDDGFARGFGGGQIGLGQG